MPVVPAIIIIYAVMICMVFFTFFTAKIAQMKLRRPLWGAMGMFFGPVGMLAVCYLPSRRKDGKETNPIRSAVRSLPGISRKLLVALLILMALVLGIIYLGTSIPKWQENAQYEKNIGTTVTDRLTYTTTVKGKPAHIVTGRDSTYLVTQDGDLYAWGYNHLSLSQEDKGAAASDVISAAQVGRDVFLIKKDNRLYKIDENGEQTKIADNVTKVVGGADFGAFLKKSGDVYVWGNNSYGQLGNASGVSSQDPLWLVGAAADISCGVRHLLVLKNDGAVMACGNNVTGALGLKDQTEVFTLKQIATGCKGIAAGSDFSLILTKDGVLKSSGANDCGQLGRVLDEEKEETEEIYLSFADVATGVSSAGAAGKSAWYIADGALYTWGANHCGQLGQGNTDDCAEPQQVMKDVTEVAMAAKHMAVIASDKVYFCGDNSYGQLGKLGETHSTLHTVVTVRG